MITVAEYKKSLSKRSKFTHCQKNVNYRLARSLETGETVESNTVENLKLQVEEILG